MSEAPPPRPPGALVPEARPASVGAAVEAVSAALGAAGVAEDVTDARLLAAEALGTDTTWLFVHAADAMPPEAWDRLRILATRRARREPLQHVLGRAEFWGLRLAVGPDVLVPRPETETLVEAVLESAVERPAPRVADVGTGSGCIALALAVELPAGVLVATDVSECALSRARRNATALGLEERVTWLLGDLTEPLVEHGPFDVLAANLPYVAQSEWPALEPEVRDHDPRSALVGGPVGTELIMRLVAEAPAVLAPRGTLALEVGAGQADAVAAELLARGWTDVVPRRDLSGIARVIRGRRPA